MWYNLLANSISTSNHISGRTIWDKLPKCLRFTQAISAFSKITRVIYPRNCSNQTCDYWLITPNQQTLGLRLISFNRGQLQISEWAIRKQLVITLQNNTVSSAMSITTNCANKQVIIIFSNKLHFSYKRLNDPSEKIMFLWRGRGQPHSPNVN